VSGLAECCPESGRGLDVDRVGDGRPVCPGPLVPGPLPALSVDDHLVQASVDLDHPADHRRVDGVVVAGNTDVVVPTQPHPTSMPEGRCDRRQRQHRRPVNLDQLGGPATQRAHRTAVSDRQPLHELPVEVCWGAELAAGKERGLQVAVGALHYAFRLGVERLQLHNLGGQRAGEPRHTLGEATATANAGLVIPNQPTRHRAEPLLEQQPNPRQQIRRGPRRQHLGSDKPRERCHHDQHRRRTDLAAAEGNLRRREPQVALRLITSPIAESIRRVLGRVLRPQQRNLLTEPRRRPGPADPLSQNRCRHRRELSQQPTNTRLDPIER